MISIKLLLRYDLFSQNTPLAFTLPSVGPLLFSEGSLQRSRQPSLQQRVPVTQFVLLLHVSFKSVGQKRLVGGLGQESETKKG